MRIISGNWKGRRLKTVKGLETRPTADKVKGAIFNILGNKVLEAKVLDLFAGTGNLSWEALSRGAKEAVLVERSYEPYKIAVENRALLGAENKALVIKMDAFKFLSQNQEKFDLIFLDPPYNHGLIDKALSIIKNLRILNSDGVIVAETASTEEILQEVHPLEIRITKDYGDTKIWFLQEVEK
ncbi:MAG: 16S rRNA (guanine(966)-N(2))-methyltransferase RsmD [Peptococcaceae bacterium]|nr:16S rRNA (guanine(966)-N(2))-methyltransferase RsmD [Peptococcaceae bacterium]